MDKNLRVAEPVIYDEFAMVEYMLPEQRLLFAVIQRAVLDYLSPCRHLRRTARRFLFEDDPEVSGLRLYAELIFTDPDGFVERLRAGLRDRTIRPNRVAAPE